MSNRSAYWLRVTIGLTAMALALAACAPAEPAEVPPAGGGAGAPAETTPGGLAAIEVPEANVTGSLTVLDWAGYDQADFWIDFQTRYPEVTSISRSENRTLTSTPR